MLKLAGAIMIVGGCLGLGIGKRQQLLMRVQVLYDLLHILDLLKSEIRYGRATLPECCRQIAERTQEPYKSCFYKVFLQMQQNTGEKFDAIFEEKFRECLSVLPLEETDRKEFLQFMASGSFVEEQMQLSTIEKTQEGLHHKLKVLEKDNAEKCRMAVGLGAMSGLFLVIILL